MFHRPLFSYVTVPPNHKDKGINANYYLETSDFLVMRFLFLVLQIYLAFLLQLIL